MKMGTLSETIEHLKNAIDRNRTDIICTVISTWQKSKVSVIYSVVNAIKILIHYFMR